MKEIIELEKHELYKLLDCLPIPMVTDDDLEKEIKEGKKLVLFGKERRVEQVPETWEELKELCKGITVGLKICKDGTIYCNEYFLARNRTPAQMWNIIKNLIGEE